MSHVVCPLCGRSFAADQYDPSDFEYDITGQSFSGKGRGMGFEVSPRYSILGDGAYDELLRKMASRALDIVKMFYDNGYLEKESIIDALSESESS